MASPAQGIVIVLAGVIIVGRLVSGGARTIAKRTVDNAYSAVGIDGAPESGALQGLDDATKAATKATANPSGVSAPKASRPAPLGVTSGVLRVPPHGLHLSV